MSKIEDVEFESSYPGLLNSNCLYQLNSTNLKIIPSDKNEVIQYSINDLEQFIEKTSVRIGDILKYQTNLPIDFCAKYFLDPDDSYLFWDSEQSINNKDVLKYQKQITKEELEQVLQEMYI